MLKNIRPKVTPITPASIAPAHMSKVPASDVAFGSPTILWYRASSDDLLEGRNISGIRS